MRERLGIITELLLTLCSSTRAGSGPRCLWKLQGRAGAELSSHLIHALCAAASSTPAAGFLGKAAMKTLIFRHRQVCFPPENAPSPSGTPWIPTLVLEEAEGTEIVSYAGQEGFRP